MEYPIQEQKKERHFEKDGTGDMATCGSLESRRTEVPKEMS